MKSTRILLIAGTLISSAALAHHGPTTSGALYETDNLVQFDGEIVGVLWRMPHVRFRLGVEDENGETVVWELETSVPALLERDGITEDLLSVGDRVRAAGYPSRFRPRSLGLRNLLLPDGREFASERVDLLWSTRRVERVEQVVDRAAAEAASVVADGIYRLWFRWPGMTFEGQRRGTGPDDYGHLLTAEARELKAAYDPVDDPRLRCEGKGMPNIMLTPTPIEIVRGDDQAIIRTTWPGPPRIIHLGGDAETIPVSAPHLGRSTGRWEDENTLVVTTTNVDWPYFDTAGTPQSDRIGFVERFTTTADRSRLDYAATATDPVMFTGPVELTFSWAWVPGETIQSNECIEWEDVE